MDMRSYHFYVGRMLLRRFYAQNRAIVLVGQQVKVTIGALADLANALLEFAEQGFTAQFFGPCIEDNALQVTGAGDLAHAHRTHENVTLPVGKTVAGINGHAGNGDGGNPYHDGRFEAFPRGVFGNARSGVIASKADGRPAVIAAGEDDVDLIAAVGAILVIPQNTRYGMNDET